MATLYCFPILKLQTGVSTFYKNKNSVIVIILKLHDVKILFKFQDSMYFFLQQKLDFP